MRVPVADDSLRDEFLRHHPRDTDALADRAQQVSAAVLESQGPNDARVEKDHGMRLCAIRWWIPGSQVMRFNRTRVSQPIMLVLLEAACDPLMTPFGPLRR
ncbi:hypothetical protein GCM10027160_26510 [Streptomyces calidiresistens]